MAMDEKADISSATLAPDEGEPVEINISVSLVSGKSLVLSCPGTEQVGQLKQIAAERLGLSGQDVRFLQDGATIPDNATAASLHDTTLDLVALAPGSIAAVVENRIVVASGSTLRIHSELDYSKSTRRSPYHLQWNPVDAGLLALRGQNMAWIHDFSQGREVFTKQCRGGRFLKWSPDGSKLALVAGMTQVEICVFDPNTEFRLEQRSETHGLAWHPKSSHLAVAQDDGVAIFNIEARAEERFLPRDSHVQLVDWHSGGELLACGDATGALQIMTLYGEARWHLRQCDAALQMGLQDRLACIAWCPNETTVAFCSSAGTAIQLFDAEAGKLIWKSTDFSHHFVDLCWNYDGTKVAGACSDGHVHVLSAKTGTTLGNFELGQANSVSWSKT